MSIKLVTIDIDGTLLKSNTSKLRPKCIQPFNDKSQNCLSWQVALFLESVAIFGRAQLNRHW